MNRRMEHMELVCPNVNSKKSHIASRRTIGKPHSGPRWVSTHEIADCAEFARHSTTNNKSACSKFGMQAFSSHPIIICLRVALYLYYIHWVNTSHYNQIKYLEMLLNHSIKMYTCPRVSEFGLKFFMA